jgi:hypothetical protein
MDPLFERRQLVKKVHIKSKYLQKNIESSILYELKFNYEGKCLQEGYIAKKSITIVNYSLGRINYIHGGIVYDVTFQADICMPHSGQRFKAPVKLRSKIGLHAELPPVKVLIPRDLNIGSEEFEGVKLNDEVEFEVIGAPQFKQEDDTIIIVGKLVNKIVAEPEKPLLSVEESPSTEANSESVPKSESGEEMRVVITAPNAEAPKKRRLKRKEEININEQFPSLKERIIEGTP